MTISNYDASFGQVNRVPERLLHQVEGIDQDADVEQPAGPKLGEVRR